MHGTLEELRDHYPGKWLLIELDDSEAEEGTVLAAHEDPEAVDKELERRFQPKRSRRRPLYVTYSIPENSMAEATFAYPIARSPLCGRNPTPRRPHPPSTSRTSWPKQSCT